MSELFKYPKTFTHTSQLCECGRLYKDRRDKNGKMMCSACYCDCNIETLKKLWSMPINGVDN